MTKVYISGPITGVKDYEKAFDKAANELTALGYKPINPVELGKGLKINLGREPTWDEYMTVCLAVIPTCNQIYLLAGWENSKGARIEWNRAKELAIEPIYLEGDYDGVF